MFPAGVAGIRVRRVALAGGLGLRIAESGGASGTPVLLLHGWGASIYMWRDWFAPLAAAGMRVIAADLPGHGLSDKPDDVGAYALERQLGVLRELMWAEDIVGAPVVAQSMGGTLALELAMSSASPVGRLALINPASFGTIRVQWLARLVSPPAVNRVLDWMLPRWIVARAHRLAYAEGDRVTPRDVDEYWAPSQFASYARAMRRLLHELEWTRAPAEQLAERMRVLRDPALVVVAGRDRIVRDARSYAYALVDARAPLMVHELPQAGHAVNEEEPSLVIPRVLAFLQRGV